MKLAGFALILGAVALPSADAAATVVPQKGMRGVEVGMSVAEVREAAGAPTRVIFVRNEILGRQRVYRYGLTDVSFDSDRAAAKVVSLSTTSRSERLANGIGVGSTRSRVDAAVRGARCKVEFGVDHCYVGTFRPGRTVTDFLIGRRGTVTRITVGRVID